MTPEMRSAETGMRTYKVMKPGRRRVLEKRGMNSHSRASMTVFVPKPSPRAKRKDTVMPRTRRLRNRLLSLTTT